MFIIFFFRNKIPKGEIYFDCFVHKINIWHPSFLAEFYHPYGGGGGGGGGAAAFAYITLHDLIPVREMVGEEGVRFGGGREIVGEEEAIMKE